MYEAASKGKNIAASAMSSAVPSRPSGTGPATASAMAGSSDQRFCIGVRIAPGRTAFKQKRLASSWIASDFDSARRLALLAP